MQESKSTNWQTLRRNSLSLEGQERGDTEHGNSHLFLDCFEVKSQEKEWGGRNENRRLGEVLDNFWLGEHVSSVRNPIVALLSHLNLLLGGYEPSSCRFLLDMFCRLLGVIVQRFTTSREEIQPPKTKTWTWNKKNNHEWRCISNQRLWLFIASHVSFFLRNVFFWMWWHLSLFLV